MTWTDPITTMKTLLDAITIPPASLGSITKLVTVGWVDVSNRGGPSGEITPQYTIKKVSSPWTTLDGPGSVSVVDFIMQIDVWCQTYGPTENSYQLNEKMVEQLRQKIKTYKSNPSSTIKYLEIIQEVNRDEADTKPILRRTAVIVKAVCRR